jgi:feruloyl esterase
MPRAILQVNRNSARNPCWRLTFGAEAGFLGAGIQGGLNRPAPMEEAMIKRTLAQVAMLAATASAAALLHPAAARADEAACASLKAAGLFKDTTIASAAMVAPKQDNNDPARNEPGYCEVKGEISPVPKSHIGVVFRLPDNWNGRVLGLGGGGWQGNTDLNAALPGLRRGYATLQTNAGHEPKTNGANARANAFDSSWAKDNPEAITDFSWRAVHLTSIVGKDVAARYYMRPLQLAVFQGCSTGGRMALMEAHRFPEDYSAIIAGAPVFNLGVQTAGLVKGRLFTTPQTALSDGQVKLITSAVLDACDKLDGVKDGLITDPRACKWDPAAIQCKPGQAASDSCLTVEQAGALRRAYADVRGADGKVVVYGLARGGEPGWGVFVALRPRPAPAGGNAINAYIYGDANDDEAKFNPVTDTAKVRSSPFATAHYYDQVRKTAGADAKVRLFLAPGVSHCGGGTGASQFDTLAAMDDWIATGKAPEVIPASNPQKGFTRPLCAWPDLPFYKGEGDPNAAASFSCRSTAGLRSARN